MIKKIFAILMFSMLGLAAATAQSAVGNWHMFPVFSGKVDQLVDAKNKVYYTSGNRLYSFDKNSNEMYTWSTANKLNDTNVAGIKYNPDGGYVVAYYNTGNIDVIDDATGRVHNLSDIKDANLNVTKTINGIGFGPGRIYAATSFGIVVFDDKKFEVKESGLYNTNIGSITETNGHIVMNSGTTLYISPVDMRHNTLDKFTKWPTSWGLYNIEPTDGGIMFNFPYLKTICSLPIDFEKLEHGNLIQLGVTPVQMPQLNDAGKYVVVTASDIVTIGKDGTVESKTAIPAALAGQVINFNRDLNSLWAGNKDGIANYSVSDAGNVTVLADKAKPEGTVTTKIPVYLRMSDDGSRIYVGTQGDSRNRKHGGTWNTLGTLDVIIDGKPYDVSSDVTYTDPINSKDQRNLAYHSILNPQSFSVDPGNPDRVAQAAFHEMVVISNNGVTEGVFNINNAPIENWYQSGVTVDAQFDRDGNLWVVQYITDYDKYSPVIKLPAAKLNGELSTVTKEDWVQLRSLCDQESQYTTWDGELFFPKQTPTVGFLKAEYNGNRIDWFNPRTMEYHKITPVLDQDGKTVSFQQINCFAEDKNGQVWCGTPAGVFAITKPSQLSNADFRVNRIKVPRNDGTNYADYLLESDDVKCIAVDGSNRKWIGTENSGLYLVSENGDEVIANYNTANSDIPSNCVFSVLCDPNSNLVYVGTLNGLATFGSTSAPAATDYSDVYAYPNPVKPGYTGYITVRGLMDNSLVKIADAAGNVVHQGRSEGSLFVWDGNNASGSRVPSGVYYVFASQNETGTSSGAVTKIVIIN